jgi:metal-sulfur cluster biosynthetic enzyme
MKKIKDIRVKVTYNVGLGDLEVDDDVFKQLNEIFDNDIELNVTDMVYSQAIEWLKENIRQRDCYDTQFNITDLNGKCD